MPEGIEGDRQADAGDSVLVSIVGRKASDEEDRRDSVDGPVFQQAKNWLVKLGDGNDLLVDALDSSLRRMKPGQTALVWSKPKYAIGESGKRIYKDYTLPPNSTVLYEVTLMQIVKDTSQINPYFSIQTALTRKNIANDLYQHEWSIVESRKRSVRLYQKAANAMYELLENGVYFKQVEVDHPQKKECQQIMVDCYNNVTAVYMRWKAWKQAREAIQVVLKRDRNNLKALVRNCKVAMSDPTVSLKESDAVLKEAEAVVVYKDKEEEEEIRKLRAQWKQKKKKAEEKKKADEAAAAASDPKLMHKLISKRYKELRKEGLDSREAMEQARTELQPDGDDNGNRSPSEQVAAMFGMRF